MLAADQLTLALLVFLLRILNNAISTMRVVFIARQRVGISTIMALVESTIFAFTVANVVNDLSNPIMLFAYSGGFAVGSYVGMTIERRFVRTFVTITAVIKKEIGHETATALRQANFGVTESYGEGQNGQVVMLRSIVDRRDANQVIELIREKHPDAFISMEEVRAIRQGYFPAHSRH